MIAALDTVLILVALGQTLFVFMYLPFPWWNSPLGRVLFIKALTTAVTVDLFVTSRLFGWPSEGPLLLILSLLLLSAVWAQLYLFARLLVSGNEAPRNV